MEHMGYSASHGLGLYHQRDVNLIQVWLHHRYSVKALVWFWWIDEILSANLVYQSDYEIGSTTPSD